MSNIAVFHIHHGKKHWLAIPLFKQALEIAMKCQTNREAEVSDGLLNIGQAQYEAGKYEEAKECFEKSLALRLKISGEKHPKVAIM